MNAPRRRRRESDPNPKYDATLAYSTELLQVMLDSQDRMTARIAEGIPHLTAVQSYLQDLVDGLSRKASEYEAAGDIYRATFFRDRVAASMRTIAKGPVDVE